VKDIFKLSYGCRELFAGRQKNVEADSNIGENSATSFLLMVEK